MIVNTADVNARLQDLIRLGNALATSIQSGCIKTDDIPDKYDTMETKFEELARVIRTYSQGDATVIPLTATTVEQSEGEAVDPQGSATAGAETLQHESFADAGRPQLPEQFARATGGARHRYPPDSVFMSLQRRPELLVSPDSSKLSDTISTAMIMPTPSVGTRNTAIKSKCLQADYGGRLWSDGVLYDVIASSRGAIQWIVRVEPVQVRSPAEGGISHGR